MNSGLILDCYAESVQQAITAAWEAPYQGSWHELLFENLNQTVRPEPFLNVCTFVQSSGTGKSRTVDEQAKLVYTLPINIRNLRTYVAYPPTDETVYHYLVDAKCYGEGACEIHCLAFFRSLFSHAAAELGQFEDHARQSQTDFAMMWHVRMKDRSYRDNFYSEVIRSCGMPTSYVSDEQRKALMAEARAALVRLSNALDRRFKNDSNIKIMVYIDEAHELKRRGSLGNSDEECTRLDVLCSVLGYFCDQPLCGLFLSTQPLLRFGEPWRIQRGISQELLAPITETPFDCAPHINISPGVLRLEDLVTIKYLAQWGRPLWWTMLENDHWGRLDREYIIDNARMKLLRKHDIDAPLPLYVSSDDKKSLVPLTAIMDVLLALDLQPSREKTREKRATLLEYETEMVASHMRIAYSVAHHRKYMMSGYSSEPLLAEAAAEQIHCYQSQVNRRKSDIMLQLLRIIFQFFGMDLGAGGNVVMRLLLTRAYMDGVLAEPTPEWSRVIFSRGCSLVAFIRKLFASEPANEILNSRPDNLRLDTTFRDTFKNSWVRFTHFARARDGSALTTEALVVAFARGMAFICSRADDHVDLAIPILLDKSDTLQESAMSAILVQMKTPRRQHRGMAYHAVYQDEIGLFPDVEDEASSRRPYFVLIAELGHDDLESSSESEESSSEDSDAEMDDRYYSKPRPKNSKIHVGQPPEEQHCDPDETHPRFSATVLGCSRSLYKVVGNNAGVYRKLLAPYDDLLDEHVRQDAESRSVVMRLKPFWKYGSDSYHWVESEMLNE